MAKYPWLVRLSTSLKRKFNFPRSQSVKRIEVIFSKRNAHEEDRNQKISVFWNLKSSPIAERYFKSLQIAATTRYIYRRDRFYNFPNEYWTQVRIVEKLNESIDLINRHSPGLIPDRAAVPMDQAYMNHLHVYFEKYRGSLAKPAPIYASAPSDVREAFDDLNLMIHRYEDLGFSGRGEQPLGEPKIHFTFGLTEPVRRYSLEDVDYKEFSFESRFGQWSINYCEVGKPLHDVWRDQDAEIGHEAVIPLRYYSADAFVHLGDERDKAGADQLMVYFNSWWDENRTAIEALGFKQHDPKNSVGTIAVAELDRSQPLLAGKSDEEVVKAMADFQWIDAVHCIGG